MITSFKITGATSGGQPGVFAQSAFRASPEATFKAFYHNRKRGSSVERRTESNGQENTNLRGIQHMGASGAWLNGHRNLYRICGLGQQIPWVSGESISG